MVNLKKERQKERNKEKVQVGRITRRRDNRDENKILKG